LPLPWVLALKDIGLLGDWSPVNYHTSSSVCLVYWIQCSWRPGLPSFHREIIPMVKYASNTFGNFLVSYFWQKSGQGPYWLALWQYGWVHTIGPIIFL